MQRCLLTLCLLLACLVVGCARKTPVASEPPPLPSKEELSKLKMPPPPWEMRGGMAKPKDLPTLPDGSTTLPVPGELPSLDHIPPPPPAPRRKKAEK